MTRASFSGPFRIARAAGRTGRAGAQRTRFAPSMPIYERDDDRRRCGLAARRSEKRGGDSSSWPGMRRSATPGWPSPDGCRARRIASTTSRARPPAAPMPGCGPSLRSRHCSDLHRRGVSADALHERAECRFRGRCRSRRRPRFSALRVAPGSRRSSVGDAEKEQSRRECRLRRNAVAEASVPCRPAAVRPLAAARPGRAASSAAGGAGSLKVLAAHRLESGAHRLREIRRFPCRGSRCC